MRRIPAALALAAILGIPVAARGEGPTLADLWAHRGNAIEGSLQVDPVAGTVQASLRVRVTVGLEGASALYFVTPIAPSSVTSSDGTPLPFAPASLDGRPLTRVSLPGPVAAGTVLEIAFDLAGMPDCAPVGAAAVRTCGFGTVSWLDLARVFPASAGLDFATMDLDVVLPAGQGVAGSGVVASVTPLPGGSESHRLVQDRPALSHGLAFGPFVQGATWFGPVPIRAEVLPSDEAVVEAVPGVLIEARAVLQAYSDRFGPYLFPALTLAEVPGAGAALALPGAAWLPPGVWTGEGGGTLHPPDLAGLVVAHEIAHQWFPGALKPAPLGGPWMSEGFAEFAALAFVEARAGEGAARDLWRSLSARYRHGVPAGSDFPLVYGPSLATAQDVDAYFWVTYVKGAWALRMLRAAAGAAVFDEALRGLVRDLGGKDAYLDVASFLKVVQDAAGRDLQAAFRPWIEGRGFPILAVGVTASPDGAGERVTVRVRRTMSAAGTPFPVGLPVVLRADGGDVALSIPVEADEATIQAVVPGRFLSLEADPAAELLFRPVAALPGDVDLSGEVDGIDLVLAAWARGADPASARWIETADGDGSGRVDAPDLGAVLAGFGLRGIPD